MANSAHARRLWRVTFRLPTPLLHGKTQRPVQTDSEFTYEVTGWHPGVATQRAFQCLRKEPQLHSLIIRDCFVSVKYIAKFTRAEEVAVKGESTEPKEQPRWLICPYCKSNIADLEPKGLAYTKHMIGECCISDWGGDKEDLTDGDKTAS